MRIYFLSCKPAILKLNGLFVGGIDLFERHIEINLSDSLLAEIVPGENLQPINFFIDEKLLFSPPPFLDIYLMEEETLIFVKEYGNKYAEISIKKQASFCGNTFTLFTQGGTYLSVEGSENDILPLPQKFAFAEFEEKSLASLPVLALRCRDALLVLSDKGKPIFMNEAEKAEFSDTLKTTTAFETCTAAKAECEYSYDGEKLTLISSRTIETRPPESGILHFAFFESVMTCGNFYEYLDDELKNKADKLKEYLGEFVGVSVPTERFYAVHPDLRAAGLIYPKGTNLYEVKYFAADIDENGKVSNIYPV